jgi:hypothetical protein
MPTPDPGWLLKNVYRQRNGEGVEHSVKKAVKFKPVQPLGCISSGLNVPILSHQNTPGDANSRGDVFDGEHGLVAPRANGFGLRAV